MNGLIQFLTSTHNQLNKTRIADGIAPLLLRLYLAPIFIIAGYGKFVGFDNTVYYFEEYLGLPFPTLMVMLAGSAELFGGIALLLGIAVRWVSIPLMITMLVAAVSAHWQFGWHALPEATLTMPWEWRTDLISEAQQRKDAAVYLLKQHGNFSWLTEAGSFTVLKNGIEFAATYFIMLVVLFFTGGGRFTSIDDFLKRKFVTK